MSEAAKRNARNRSAGKAWERALEQGLRKLGFDADRTRDTGTHDQGDLVVREGGRFIVIEAKNAKFEPSQFIREAQVEADNFADKRGLSHSLVHPVSFVKKRGVGLETIEDHYAVLSIGDYLKLVGST